jgi:hypothetical protein
MAPKLDSKWTDKFMRRDTPGMRPRRHESHVKLFDIVLFGGRAGTSSDPVCSPDPKIVRQGDSRMDRIHVDDVEGLGLGGAVSSLPTMYTRRTNKSVKKLFTDDLRDLDYYDNAAAHRAVHRDYPNPHNYTVRTIHKDDLTSRGCRCADGCQWDPVTDEAEFLCGCGNRRNDPGEYVGEPNDHRKMYMEHDLCVPGSMLPKNPKTKTTQSIFGGNPYKC